MKKFTLLALSIVLVSSFACSKIKKTTKLMTGKWNIAKKEYTYSFNNTVDPSVSFTIENKGSIELLSDGTGSFNDANKDGTTKAWTIVSWYNDEDELAMVVKDANGYTGSYTFTGITDDKEAQTITWNYKNNNNRAGLLIEEKSVLKLAKAE